MTIIEIWLYGLAGNVWFLTLFPNLLTHVGWPQQWLDYETISIQNQILLPTTAIRCLVCCICAYALSILTFSCIIAISVQRTIRGACWRRRKTINCKDNLYLNTQWEELLQSVSRLSYDEYYRQQTQECQRREKSVVGPSTHICR